MSVGARAAKGVIWIAGGGAAQAILGAAALVILARSLTPTEFGAAAAALAAITIVDMLCTLVLPDVLRAHAEIDDAHIDATFWAALIVAVLGAIGMTSFAPQIAALFGVADPLVFAATPWLLPLGAMGAVPGALLARELNFRHGAGVGAASSFAGFLTGVVGALAGLGVWSLVVMEFARRLSALALGMALVAWRPSFRGGLRAFSSLAHFNAHSTAFYALGFLDDFLTRLLISRLLGVESLGIYAMARRLLEATQGAVVGPFAGVTLSAAARLRDDRAGLQAMLLGLYQGSSLIAFPAFLGLIAIAPILTPAAFGAQWAPAVAPLQILLLLGLTAATGAFNAGVLRGCGRPDLMNRLRGASVLAMLVLLPLAAPYGLIAACAALVARAWLVAPLGVTLIAKTTGLSPRAQTQASLSVLPAAVGMSIAAWFAGRLLADVPPAAAIILIVPASVLLYLGLLALFAPHALAIIKALSSAIIRRDRGAVDRILGQTPAEGGSEAPGRSPV